jgi:hypothetical protein
VVQFTIKFMIFNHLCYPRLNGQREELAKIPQRLLLKGKALDKATAFTRRKHLVANWFNHDWLSRVMAVCSFLARGKPTIRLAGNTRASSVTRCNRSYSSFGEEVPMRSRSIVGHGNSTGRVICDTMDQVVV